MTVTVGGSNITFNDSTTQSTAFTGNFVNGQAFTSPGTFTVPTNVTNIKVTVIGGGAPGSAGTPAVNAFGGGAGGICINYIPTSPGATFPVTVGSASGTSSFGSNATATGGASSGPGGSSSAGAINGTGMPGNITNNSTPNGGSSQFGGGGNGAGASATGYGSGGGGPLTPARVSATPNGSGAPGVVIVEW
jgi:hypothetical protein